MVPFPHLPTGPRHFPLLHKRPETPPPLPVYVTQRSILLQNHTNMVLATHSNFNLVTVVHWPPNTKDVVEYLISERFE